MTDEDIQAMKERQAARSPLGNSHWNAAYIDIAKLLFEVEALHHLMLGWQSVADGAMPAADVGVIVFLEQESAPSVCGLAYLPSLDTTPPNVGAWRMLWVGPDMKIEAVDHRRVTHWMPLPPPPIKRES